MPMKSAMSIKRARGLSNFETYKGFTAISSARNDAHLGRSVQWSTISPERLEM